MSTPAPPEAGMHKRLRRMTGRDPEERHRSASPLELLFDLTFVVAFGVAANEAARYAAEGHWAPAIWGFLFAMMATIWAWINYSWFASAYDTDDWLYRVLTMVQMVGVLVLALGIPVMFQSIDEGTRFANDIIVAGYVVMRLAMVAQWLRAAAQHPAGRRTALRYAAFVTASQVGWVTLLALRDAPLPLFIAAAAITVFLDFGGPSLAERGHPTPWHPHHIAERYGLLAIIALGEGVIGTVAAVSAVIGHQGWSREAILLVIAGTGLTFGMWWCYFTIPSGLVLARHRERSWIWGYTHAILFASIAATGAGLHVAAYQLEGEARIGMVAAVLTVVIPVLVFGLCVFALYAYLVRELDPFHFLLLGGMLAVLALSVFLAGQGVELGWCLIVAMLSPAVVVVGYETIGHRHGEAALARIAAGG
jgi:low temperature requirement protein LtrA